MVVVIPYFLRHLVEGLGKINDVAVSMPTIYKIVYVAVLVAFTD